MPRIPTYEWIERTVGAKNNRKQSSVTSTWNLVVREVKVIAKTQAIILRRLDAYGERLRNIEQEVCITSNATNSGVEEIEGVKKARRVLEIKMLKTFDFMDGKLDYIHAKIDEIKENQTENVED